MRAPASPRTSRRNSGGNILATNPIARPALAFNRENSFYFVPRISEKAEARHLTYTRRNNSCQSSQMVAVRARRQVSRQNAFGKSAVGDNGGIAVEGKAEGW